MELNKMVTVNMPVPNFIKNTLLYKTLKRIIFTYASVVNRVFFPLWKMAKWEKKQFGKKESIFKIHSLLKNQIKSRVVDTETVCFIVELPIPRLLKIVKALKAKGLKVHILYLKTCQDLNCIMEQVKEYADKYSEYDCVVQLMWELLHSTAFVIHYFMAWGFAFNTCSVLCHKKLFTKIVVEHYDVINGMYTGEDSYGCYNERYCFEHADGVIFREFSGEYLENELHFKMKNQLIFLDYFSEKEALEKTITEDSNSELSFVYAGGLHLEKLYPNSPLACWLEVADICRKNATHIHIYPVIDDDELFSDYIELSKNNKYFHFHKTVPYSELYAELVKYDYHLMPCKPSAFDKVDQGCYTLQKNIYAATNKFFDSIASGLPIIAVMPKRFAEEFEKIGVLIPYGMYEIDFDYLKEHRKEMWQKVKENRNRLSIENNINRLIEFYRNI